MGRASVQKRESVWADGWDGMDGMDEDTDGVNPNVAWSVKRGGSRRVAIAKKRVKFCIVCHRLPPLCEKERPLCVHCLFKKVISPVVVCVDNIPLL